MVLGAAGWHYLSKTEKKTLIQQMVLVVFVAALALTVIAIHHLFFAPDYRFPKAVAGVLVLRLDGDTDNSYQKELVSSLNEELAKEFTDSKEAPRRKMEVRASKESVTEEVGLSQAHKAAREIGRKSRAVLVIWGTCVGAQNPT